MAEVIVGLISDTHGRIRASALDALRGCDLIVHAGDVGGSHVLEALRTVAPVHAVRGNTDVPDNPALESTIELKVGGLRLHVSHGHELGSPTPEALVRRYEADVIVFGHTHRAEIARIGRTLVVNPGAAGPARFRVPLSVGLLRIGAEAADAEIIELAP